MYKQLTAAVCLTLVLAASDVRADKTETFDSAASASSDGWVVTGSGVDGQLAGFIATNDAGGAAAGEAQFDVFRGVELSYLDKNLGLTINGNGGFSMSGKLNYVGNTGVPDLGYNPVIGYSSGPNDYLGITFRGDIDDLGSDLSWGIRFENSGDGIRINGGGDFSRVLSQNVPRTFSLVYDPNDGANGTITASVSDAGSPIVHSLSATNRMLLNNAAFTQFGILHHAVTADSGHGEKLRFDDLTYTGVPGTSIGVPGDYNNNGVVDAADYVVWRHGGPLENEVDTPGSVDGQDYTDWRARFGNPAGIGSLTSPTTIPEPTTLIILVISACWTTLFQSRTRL